MVLFGICSGGHLAIVNPTKDRTIIPQKNVIILDNGAQTPRKETKWVDVDRVADERGGLLYVLNPSVREPFNILSIYGN